MRSQHKSPSNGITERKPSGKGTSHRSTYLQLSRSMKLNFRPHTVLQPYSPKPRPSVAYRVTEKHDLSPFRPSSQLLFIFSHLSFDSSLAPKSSPFPAIYLGRHRRPPIVLRLCRFTMSDNSENHAYAWHSVKYRHLGTNTGLCATTVPVFVPYHLKKNVTGLPALKGLRVARQASNPRLASVPHAILRVGISERYWLSDGRYRCCWPWFRSHCVVRSPADWFGFIKALDSAGRGYLSGFGPANVLLS